MKTRKNLYWTWLIALISYAHTVQAQSTVIQGKVLSLDGQKPIAGANIKLTGKKTQTTSDGQGLFTLSLDAKEVQLEVSHLQYRTARLSLQLPLKDTLIVLLATQQKVLDEVLVSTGYQDLSKESSTGSFEVIDKELLERTVSSDILARLNNMTTGTYIDPTSESINFVGMPRSHDFTIRGVSSVNLGAGSSTAPLIILDNFPYEGDINGINPNEIESVTLLKDAAASSIWGAKAGNGVIVIKSKQGSYDKPLQLNFSTDYLMHDKANLYGLEGVSNKDLIEIERDLFTRKHFTLQENSAAKPLLSPIVELLIAHRDGHLTDQQLEDKIAPYNNQDIRDDLLRYVYRNALKQRYNLEVQGGGTRNSFISGFGYDRSLAGKRGTSDNRLTYRLNNTMKLSDKLELQAGLRWIGASTRNPTASISYSDQGYPLPYIRLVNEAGNPAAIPYQYRTSFMDQVEEEGLLLDWRFRPLEEMNNGGKKNRRDEVIMQASLKYKLFDWLDLRLRYQYNKDASREELLYDMDSFYARNLINRGTSIQAGKPFYNFPVGGILDNYRSDRTSSSGRMQTDIHKNWTDFKLTGLLGMDILNTVTNTGGEIKYGYVSELMNYDHTLDFTKTYSVYANLASSERIPAYGKAHDQSIHRFVSVFSNASLSYKDRYILTGSARRDASNLFGVATNNKWTPLWSIGGAWLLHKEKFMEQLPFDILKIRGSYGFSGNVDSQMSGKTVFSYSSTNTPEVDYPSGAVLFPPNPSLRWEKVGTLNFGLDFTLFGNRLTGSVDAYRKLTKDLINSMPLDLSTGFSTMSINVGSTKSLGVDVNLGYRMQGSAFNWQTNLLFSYNNNWVLKSYQPYSPTSLVRNWTVRTIIEDQMIFTAYSYRWAGLDPADGVARGYLDGEISRDHQRMSNTSVQLEDLVFHGSSRPLYYGAFRNAFSYGSLTLSANISYRFDYYFRRKGMDYALLYGSRFGHKDYYDRWQKAGDELTTHVPAFQYPVSHANTFYQYAEVLTERGDHIRLNDVRLDYTLPLKSSRAKHVRVFVQGNNLGILWRANKLKLDPNIEGGIPLPRAYSLGLKVNL